MLKNKKITASVVVTAMVVMASAVMVSAQTANLSATCSGVVANNVITWTATASGGTAPYSYIWTGINIGGSTSSVVSATYGANGTYQAGVHVGDTTTSTVNANCSATVSSFPSNTTTTPPVVQQKFKQPELNINPAGHFLARGMKVVSVNVATNSFVGSVWGTTWTVNLSDSPEFYLREGKFAGNTSINQLQVGDEVGVSGKVDQNNAGIVYAGVVRNYSILKLRSESELQEHKNKNENEGENENEGNRGNSSNEDRANGIRAQIQQILDQIKAIQDKIKNQ